MSLKKDIGEVQHTPSVKQGITTDYSSSIGADSWDLTPINNALNAASGLVQQATTIATERKVNAYTRQTTDLYDRYGKVEEQLADTVKQIELGHQDENTLADYYKTRERLLNGDAQGSIRGLATQIRQIKARFRSDHPRLTAHFDKVDSNFGDFDIAKREKDSIDKAREKTFLDATSMAMTVPEYEIYQHKLATAKALEAQQSIAKSSGIIDVRDTALKTSVGLWTATALTEWRKKLNSGSLTDQEVISFRAEFENEFNKWKQEEMSRLVRDGATMEGVGEVLQLDSGMIDSFFDASSGEAMMANLIKMQTQDSILTAMKNFPAITKASGYFGGNLDKAGEFIALLPSLQARWGAMGEGMTKAQIQSGGPEVQNMLLWIKMNSTPEAKAGIVDGWRQRIFEGDGGTNQNVMEIDSDASITATMLNKGAVIPETDMKNVVSSLFRAEGSLAFSDMVDPVKAATARRNNPSIAMEWRNQSTAAAEKNLDEIADYFAYNQAGAGKLVALGKDKRGDLTRSASGRAIAGTFFSINGADGKEDKTMSYHVKKNLRMLNEKAQALYNLDPALAEEFIEETVNSAVLEKYTGSKRDKAYKLLDEAARYENRPLSIYERDRVEAKQDYLNIADSLKQQAYSILEGDMNVAQAEAATAQFDPTVDDTPPTNLGGPEENPSKGKGMDDLSNVENVELPTKMPYSEVKVDPKKSDAFARKTAEWTEQMNSSDDSKTQKVYEDVSRLLEQMGMKSLPRVETIDEMRQVLDLNGIYESITQGGNLEADLAKQGKVDEEIVDNTAVFIDNMATKMESRGEPTGLAFPTNDEGDDHSFDIGYGHKITAAEASSGTIHGIKYKNDDGTDRKLTLAEMKTIASKDYEHHVNLARKVGWDSKLKAIGTSWDALDEQYKMALGSLAYNVGGAKAGEDWTAVLKAAKNKNLASFAKELRRQDAGKYSKGMDNRVAKELYYAGLITSLDDVATQLPLATELK